MPLALIILIALALIFNFLNGVHDSSNIVATMISSRAVPPRVALTITALAEFAGPFLFGVAVATTIGTDIVSADAITITVLNAALLSGIAWNLLTWILGIPSSSSHALIGGMIGAVIIAAGMGAVHWDGVFGILAVLFLSPVIGLVGGYLFTRLVFFLVQGATPSINWAFKRGQLLTATVLAFSHGTNDAQKAMGIITLGLVTTGYLAEFEVPFWVILVSSLAIALGTALGGWSLIKTLGAKLYRIRPVDGFCAQSVSALVILSASLLGGPVSTTQVVSTAIMGVGAAERLNKVRWGVGVDIALAWLITIPANALLAAGIYWLLSYIF